MVRSQGFKANYRVRCRIWPINFLSRHRNVFLYAVLWKIWFLILSSFRVSQLLLLLRKIFFSSPSTTLSSTSHHHQQIFMNEEILTDFACWEESVINYWGRRKTFKLRFFYINVYVRLIAFRWCSIGKEILMCLNQIWRYFIRWRRRNYTSKR